MLSSRTRRRRGPGIPSGTTITAVASTTSLTMSANATANGTYVEIVDIAVDTACAVLDLYEALAAEGDTGYTAASKDGLMYDTVHETQVFHNEISRRVVKVLEMF
jgi:hypothetical protein